MKPRSPDPRSVPLRRSSDRPVHVPPRGSRYAVALECQKVVLDSPGRSGPTRPPRRLLTAVVRALRRFLSEPRPLGRHGDTHGLVGVCDLPPRLRRHSVAIVAALFTALAFLHVRDSPLRDHRCEHDCACSAVGAGSNPAVATDSNPVARCNRWTRGRPPPRPAMQRSRRLSPVCCGGLPAGDRVRKPGFELRKIRFGRCCLRRLLRARFLWHWLPVRSCQWHQFRQLL